MAKDSTIIREEIRNLTSEELLNIDRYGGHNSEFNFPLWVSKLKEHLEKKTGQRYYIGEDCQFHPIEPLIREKK